MGAVPDFWLVIRDARYLNVAPWDFIGVPESAGHECWTHWVRMSRRLDEHLELWHSIQAKQAKNG